MRSAPGFQLATRPEAPPGVWRQLFAAQTLRGDALGAAAARIGLARTVDAKDSDANIAGELTVLAYVADPLAHAADVLALAKAANVDEETPLDAALAASFNNVTGRILEASRKIVLGATEKQALQAGAAVVASDVDGIPEDVKHGESALLVKPGSVPELTQALTNLLSNPDLRLRLANQGRELFATRFSADVFARGRPVDGGAGRRAWPHLRRRGGPGPRARTTWWRGGLTGSRWAGGSR